MNKFLMILAGFVGGFLAFWAIGPIFLFVLLLILAIFLLNRVSGKSNTL